MTPQRKYSYIVADDEYSIIKILTDILNIHPDTSKIVPAKDGLEALEIFKEDKIDVIITDILMPRLSGIELVKEVKQINPDVQIIVVSAFGDIDLVREAMRCGAYDYVLKPFNIDDIMLAVNRTIERLKFLDEQKNYVKILETKVRETTESLNKGFLNSLYTLVNALEARDQYTHLHSRSVSEYAVKIANMMNLDDERVKNIEIAGFIHDIGKIGIPDSILLKPARLTAEEFDFVKRHPEIGFTIIQPSMGENRDVMDFVICHHERFDGGGYPHGLKGEKIPVVSRVATLADSFDAMTSDRLYRKGLGIDEAIEDIKKNSGSQFDPEISKIFIDSL
jgi:response regulator RpfG family c-di-GMP phosphodiesterase